MLEAHSLTAKPGQGCAARPHQLSGGGAYQGEFREAVRSIGAMMQESSVLEREEQDQLGMAFANLEMAAGLYDTRELTAESAKNVLALIDEAVSVIEQRGLLHGPVKAPWESEAKG